MSIPHAPKRRLILWFTLAVAFAAPLAGASTLAAILDRGALVVGTSANMPLMSFTDEQGRVTGFDIDLARFMANAMKVRLETRVMPFDALIPALEKGEVDMVLSNLTITPERNFRVAFAGPYLVSGKCVVTRDEALARGPESTDLNTGEVKVAVLEGSTSEAFARELLPNATLIGVSDYDSAVKLVRDEEANGLLTDYPICLSVLKANPEAGFASLFSMLTYEPIGIALPAGDAHLLNFVENLLERLDKTDVIDQLGKLWFGGSLPGQ